MTSTVQRIFGFAVSSEQRSLIKTIFNLRSLNRSVPTLSVAWPSRPLPLPYYSRGCLKITSFYRSSGADSWSHTHIHSVTFFFASEIHLWRMSEMLFFNFYCTKTFLRYFFNNKKRCFVPRVLKGFGHLPERAFRHRSSNSPHRVGFERGIFNVK